MGNGIRGKMVVDENYSRGISCLGHPLKELAIIGGLEVTTWKTERVTRVIQVNFIVRET